MRLHRFFVSQVLNNNKDVVVSETPLLHQWKSVFRLKGEDQVILLDNSGFEYVCEIKILSRKEANLVVIEKRKSLNVPIREVYIFASLIKKDRFEWILEKGTELGVSHFVPVISDRSENKNLNLERAKKIITEASEQSGRGTLPVIHKVLKLDDALTAFPIPLVVLHTNGDKNISLFEGDNRVGVFIGPEGGWSEGDLELLKKYSVPLVKLGEQTLRAETAAIAVASILLLKQ
jgi:16S rRNA (uracil1498-N3)-methyltransferase